MIIPSSSSSGETAKIAASHGRPGVALPDQHRPLDRPEGHVLPQPVTERASFAVPAEKRTTLELAIDHLASCSPVVPETIELPPGAPFGAVAVDKDKCTLCMSCVGACPRTPHCIPVAGFAARLTRSTSPG